MPTWTLWFCTFCTITKVWESSCGEMDCTNTNFCPFGEQKRYIAIQFPAQWGFSFPNAHYTLWVFSLQLSNYFSFRISSRKFSQALSATLLIKGLAPCFISYTFHTHPKGLVAYIKEVGYIGAEHGLNMGHWDQNSCTENEKFNKKIKIPYHICKKNEEG